MSLDAEIRDSAYQFFVQEAIELLQTIEEGLLTLRTDRSTPKVHNVMRAAHSIKGGAASVELHGIKDIAHNLEDAFRALYHEDIDFSLDLEELLLLAFDSLRLPLMQQIETGSYDEAAALSSSEHVFEAIFAILGDRNSTEAEMPTSAELGVDIIEVVFQGDVASGMTRLENVLANPEINEVAGELRAQAEVFVGLGELFNLPGFTAIAQATIDALKANPEFVIEIGFLAIADLQLAMANVLAGDRTQGGTPSNELIELGVPLAHHSSNLINEALTNNITETNLEDNPEANLNTFNDLNVFLGTVPLDITDYEDDAFGFTQDINADVNTNLNSADYQDEVPSFANTAAFDGESTDAEDEALDLLPKFGHNSFDDTEIEVAAIAINPISSSQLALTNLAQEEDQNPPLQATETKPIANSSSPIEGMVQSVRVDLNRLERLNNLVGELIIQENSYSLQNQNLQGTLKVILKRFAKFEALAEGLRNWADNNQNIGIKKQDTAIATSTKLDLNTAPSFDLLELDSYSNLYALVQAAVEEMAQIGESIQDVNQITKQSDQLTRKKHQTLKQLRDDLLWSRMLPLRDILHRLPRMVRDLSKQTQKQVDLKMVGVNTLIDKAILERLYDPLIHLVRNAFDHGIEMPHVRTMQGKPAKGTIEIRAYHRGNQTYIEVRDDGNGIDMEKVRHRATTMNLLPPSDVSHVSEKQLYECLFVPGFSTAAQVSQLSGRGMGLDAVQIQVKNLKGAITISSEPNQGTTFTIRLPLTLSIAKLLVFSINSRLLAIPIDSLLAINSIKEEEIQTIQERQFYAWEEQLVQVCPSSFLSYNYGSHASEGEINNLFKTMALDRDKKLLLIAHGDDVIALKADLLVAEQEFAIKPFGKAIAPPPYLYGCTILGDGRLVPVIDGAALVLHWLQPETQQQISSEPLTSLSSTDFLVPNIPTVLVVDDSLTMRQTLGMTLQKHNYRVLQARDGREALEQLQKDSSIQVIFCDIEMPVMNGFEFLTQYRSDFSDRLVPVVMLTTRSSPKHRQLATYLGARFYLTKPFLEQELLQTLQTCLQNRQLITSG